MRIEDLRRLVSATVALLLATVAALAVASAAVAAALASTTVAAATVASTALTTVASASTSTSSTAGISEVYFDAPAIELGLVEGVDGLLSEVGVAVSNEPEAARATSLAIAHHDRILNNVGLAHSEVIAQGIIRSIPTQVSNVNF